MPLIDLTAKEIAEKVRKKEISAKEVAKAFLEKSKKDHPKVQAFIEIHEKEFLKSAEDVDKKAASGKPLGILAGVPIAIKDNLHIEGQPPTAKVRKSKTGRDIAAGGVRSLPEREPP